MGWKKNKIQRKPIGFIGLLFISINISSDFVLDSVNNHKQKYEDVAMKIWNYAELGYQENKSADLLAQSLEDEGFSIKKNLAENKISQMKEAAIKDIKKASIKIAMDSVKKIITTSVDKSKLDTLFQKNLDETKEELKKINS